jgi:hypothetical protein
MPQYSFKCDKCDALDMRDLTISEFLKLKKTKIQCDKCEDGVFKRQIISVSSEIERSTEERKMQNKEEVRKIVKKIKAGDEKTIRDIYGDKPNASKQ